jgi:HlyD family secretion protein
MKISRPHWYLAAAALLIVAVLAYAFAPRPVPVELARAAAGPLRVTIDEDGRTRIRERYVVSAPLGGHLRRIELHPGDAVIAGKTRIATIEPAAPELLDPRTRAQLEARRQVAETQVQLAGPRIERARAAQELALSELARAETLAAEQALSRQEFDRVREASRAANEELKSAEYARQIAGFELEQARAALLRSTPDTARGDHTWELCVTSPIDGRVLRVFHEDAAVVPTSARLVEVGDPTDLEAEIDVLSSDAVRIRPGARVLFEHWGGDRPLEGRVRVVEPAGFLKISALGVEEQRVNVIVDFVTPPDQRRALGDAYRVEARIVVWEAERVLKVPVGALFRSEGDWTVFAVRSGRARLLRVEVGHSNGRETAIVSGLTAGDEVILHPSDKIADGVAIRVREPR